MLQGEVEKTEELIDPPEVPKPRRRPKEPAKPAAEINERKRQVPGERATSQLTPASCSS